MTVAAAAAATEQTSPAIAPRERETTPLVALHPEDRVAVALATLRLAADENSDAAVREAISLCDEDASYSFEYGKTLVDTLAARGDYRAALRFVIAEETEGDLGENASKWLTCLFNRWGATAPREALQAIDAIVPAGWRDEARQVVAGAWGQVDPSGVARFLEALPRSSDRDLIAQAASRFAADVN